MLIQAKIRAFLAKPTHRRWIIGGFKLLILLFLGWAIYQQVFQRDDLGTILSGFRQHFSSRNAGWLVLAVLLMPVNWGLEAQKWRMLLRPEVKLSFRRALAAILAGISVSIFTPNRIGEYGGRLFGLPAGKHWLGLAATFAGSMAQWVVLLPAGLWGLGTVSMDVWPALSGFYDRYHWILWGLTVVSAILYINLGSFWAWLGQRQLWTNSRWAGWIKLQKALPGYKEKTLLWALSLASCRYLVYSSQYLFLFYGFGFQPDPLAGLAGIALIFLIQSSIPLPPFMALVARGELALLLWAEYGVNELVILASTFALFIINLLIPALLGGVTIVKIK